MGDFLEAADFLGEPIRLRYKGKAQVHTIFGGLLSLVFTGIWLYIVSHELGNLINGSGGQLSTIMAKDDLAKKEEIVQFADFGID